MNGQQAIVPSVHEACNTFLSTRLPKSLKGLPIRIVLVSNGGIKQEVQEGYAALSSAISTSYGYTLDFWGMDQLSPLIEQHLFDEALLLGAGKSDLRAALAGLEETQSSIGRFFRFVDQCFAGQEVSSSSSSASAERLFQKRCAAACMGQAVLHVWGKNEGNLKPVVAGGEYLLLRLWTEAVKSGRCREKSFQERMQAATVLHVHALHAYFEKVAPSLVSKRAVLQHRPNHVLYADLVFEELGRLATLLLILQTLPDANEPRKAAHRLLKRLLNEHTGCHLPVLDEQTIDISLVIAALLGEGDAELAKHLVEDISQRLEGSLRNKFHLPVDTDLLEDALALHITGDAEPSEFFQTTTLVPALATCAAVLGAEEVLERLRVRVHPLLADVTLERWFAQISLETLTGTRDLRMYGVGVSRALAAIRDTCAEELEASLKTFPGVASGEDFKWHGTPFEVLVALSARLNRHPLPTWFLARYAHPTVTPTSHTTTSAGHPDENAKAKPKASRKKSVTNKSASPVEKELSSGRKRRSEG
jgi:hypothetical protein